MDKLQKLVDDLKKKQGLLSASINEMKLEKQTREKEIKDLAKQESELGKSVKNYEEKLETEKEIYNKAKKKTDELISKNDKALLVLDEILEQVKEEEAKLVSIKSDCKKAEKESVKFIQSIDNKKEKYFSDIIDLCEKIKNLAK